MSDFQSTRLLGVKLWKPFPIAYWLHSSCAVVLGHPVYGSDAPRFIRALHRLFCRISDGIWWIKYRTVPKHQYHLIRTGLRPGFHDTDAQMLHGMMALLCEHVERGCGGESKLAEFTDRLRDPAKQDKNAPDGLEESQADRQTEMLTVYRWWKKERPADRKRRAAMINALYGREDSISWVEDPNDSGFCQIVPKKRSEDEEKMQRELWGLEEKISDDEQKMLHRLVDIRQSLWT